MPVKSLNSSVLRWPSRDAVLEAAGELARRLRQERPEVVRVGVIGSAARGVDWGVGSDLDLVVVLARSDEPRERRLLDLDTRDIPVPVDLLVYTAAEMDALHRANTRFARTLTAEALWLT